LPGEENDVAAVAAAHATPVPTSDSRQPAIAKAAATHPRRVATVSGARKVTSMGFWNAPATEKFRS
jgi:hypothetical protein